jgi:hypothetical protein
MSAWPWMGRPAEPSEFDDWRPECRPHTPRPQMTRAHCEPYRAFAGPYNSDERWMLENALADLRRAQRRFTLVRETADRPDLLSIFVQ